MARADLQRIYDVLKVFRGQDSLKRLFWQELNYDRANETLSRRTWPERRAALLAEDPVLFATAGGEGDFHLIYCRLAADRLSLGDERELINRLYQDHPHALFIFSDRQERHWHLVNVKQGTKHRGQMLFRRIAVGPGEQVRTASERIAMLDPEPLQQSMFGVSALAIQECHDKAFDVEAVTKKFFEEYRKVFERVEEAIRGLADADRKRLFVQRLFNRLMFLAFVQKKGWLRYPGADDETSYLEALWQAYARTSEAATNFYRDRLQPLFFKGLNTQQKDAPLQELIGEVPYLNGGLFEEDAEDRNAAIVVPDEAIRAILHDLFARFNFTVTESTPLDVEIAVDPEMLGKIFEELVTGRHETGSYYTPKPVVSFMCREALKGYLATAMPYEKPEEIARFVDEQISLDLKDPERTLDALRTITVCDPACGSGAYLLGMLHELLDLRASLFSARAVDQRSVYERKLEIIQKNVYGVDIDPFAVNIARLRLWLSLAVDYEGQNPPPLPNLDFKVEVGNSLMATLPTGGSQSRLYDDAMRRYREAKDRYMEAHGEEKAQLREEIEHVQQEVAGWVHADGSVAGGFDWAVAFAEVFDRPEGQRGGFDIVLANPPYVRQELIKEQKPRLKIVFPSVYTGTADLYCYFYARAIELLRDGGMLVFISSNKWFRAGYGAKLRKFVAETCDVQSITDFGELPVFNAATFPMIFVAQRGHAAKVSPVFTRVTTLEPPYPDVLAIVRRDGAVLGHDAIRGESWVLVNSAVLRFLRRMEISGVTLDTYVGGHIYYGIKSGLNDAFVVDGSTRAVLSAADPRSTELIKPVLIGDDIRKWSIRQSDKYFIYAPWDLQIDRYPAIKRHLHQWEQELRNRSECRDGVYQWWCMARYRPQYSWAFGRPKIVFPDIGKAPRFAFDTRGAYPDTTIFFIPLADYFLLGVLNSNSAWAYLSHSAAVLGDADRGGRLRLKRMYMQQLPIPDAGPADQMTISDLVKKCLDAKGVDCEAWEQEIDERVARLYGVNLGDIKAAEPAAVRE